VYLVVLFHAGSDRFDSGFVGVDVFFVLSGFLVTQLLLRDLAGGGSIRFGRFYARRIRRLLPAAFVALIVTALVFTAIASPVEVLDAVGAFKAAFLYVTNWYFIDQAANYFGADLSSNPVLHFWSLAVEEQFYLLWPLLLGGLYFGARRFTRRPWLLMRIVVLIGAVASLLWALSLRKTDPNRAYYGTDARAYQLMAGALLALTPAVIARFGCYTRLARWAAAGGLLALLVVASSWSDLDAIQRGVAVTVITFVIIAALEAASGSGGAGWLLSTEPMVYLGKISYGTYLWHWPVVLVITRTFDPSTLSTIALTALIATALASLSFQLLERPIRISALFDRHRRAVIAIGIATSVIAALVIIPAITKRPTSTAATAGTDLTTTGFTPVPNLDLQKIRKDLPALPNCLDKDPSACILVHGTGKHILLIGDSHAGAIVPAFTELAQADNLTFSASIGGGCPWQRGLYVVPLPIFGQTNRLENCERLKEDTYERVIPALQPDVIVTMNLGREQPGILARYLGPDQQSHDTPEADAWFEQTTTDSIAQLRAGGRDVVLLEPVPFKTDFNAVDCLSTAKVVEECRFVADADPSPVEQLYRRLDRQDDHVWSADLDNLVCPYFPICDPIVNHQVVKFDNTHITKAFARTLGPALGTYLKQNAIIGQ
jgi:peptidoglycan/LPS O-acetylase OafA/YrhL